MKTSHLVTVLGRELSVKSSAPAEKVQAVETFVNERLQQIGAALKSSDAQLVLMLALLNTTEELLDARTARTADSAVDSRMQEMLHLLERA